MVNKSVHNINHNDCSGCKMCGDICPKEAITFELDKGFWYPVVIENKCVNCGLCIKRCPSLKTIDPSPKFPESCYGVKSRNEYTRENSTSGGFFSEIANVWMAKNGYCIAALYDNDCRITHQYSNDSKTIALFRQSKYAQSDTKGIYRRAKQLLNAGEKVFFCGTPCQVEALYSFLGIRSANLLTMDFVCLGICSPFVYRKYLDMLETKFCSKVRRVWFKNKTYGWRSISTRIDFENGQTYIETGSDDLFMISFVTDALSMRPSCEFCKFRKIPHHSDFTVADFWGVEKINPSIDDNMGVSAVLVNTSKGMEWFNNISYKVDYFQTNVREICQGNFSTLKPMKPNANRDAFFDYLENHTFEATMSKFSSYRGYNKFRKRIRRFRKKLARWKNKKLWSVFH